jgi:hypothetical protein
MIVFHVKKTCSHLSHAQNVNIAEALVTEGLAVWVKPKPQQEAAAAAAASPSSHVNA